MQDIDEFTLWLWLCSFNYKLIPVSLERLKNGCDSVKAQFQKWHSKSFNRRKEKYLNHKVIYILDVQEMSWTMQVVIPQIELKAQVRPHPVQRHMATMRCPQDEIPHRGDMFWDFWINWALSPRVFYISRSHLDVGFWRACEVTGRSYSRSLYYNKSVKCLCSGNSNNLKLSSDTKENLSGLYGYLLHDLLLNSKVSCWAQAKITVLSGLILQMRREPRDH